MTNPEQWLPISGWEGCYEISDHGRVRSCDRLVQHAKGGMALKNGKVLKNRVDSKGYPFVGLYRASKGTQERVHRLVAKAFIPNPRNLPQVNHIDGDRANPAVANLEWVTLVENLRHAHDVLNRWTTGYHTPRSPRNPKMRAAA
jgi:hypothetical protein